MSDGPEIFVTLSTFSREAPTPNLALEASGYSFKVNESGRRIRPEEVLEQVPGVMGLIAGVEPYKRETLSALPNLKAISRCGVGIDAIDLDAAKDLGIAVLNTPQPPIDAVAELTLTFILALLRDLPALSDSTHKGEWKRRTGRILGGRTVGLIGLGRIGRRTLELLRPFGVRIVAVDPAADATWAAENGIELTDLDGVLSQAEIVSIHTAGGSGLRLGAREFGIMPPGAYLINTARGEVVDDVALRAALDSGHLAGAALDVFPEEPYHGALLGCERVIATPHQATLTLETRVAMELEAVNNLVSFLGSQ